MAKRKQTQTFEASLSELETLVDSMESGDLPLDEALKSFERGVELTRQCQLQLKEAEQKVQILTGNSPDATLEPFNNDE
ncbi:MAG: exodeoxyribonuclease VII small subunit [Candidatus Polarisedimenticolaceae bacterium]|nr:exodeoxyribonuclease VII small subunit [Candidatus Polarisedimenticolaceae bacterium]